MNNAIKSYLIINLATPMMYALVVSAVYILSTFIVGKLNLTFFLFGFYCSLSLHLDTYSREAYIVYGSIFFFKLLISICGFYYLRYKTIASKWLKAICILFLNLAVIDAIVLAFYFLYFNTPYNDFIATIFYAFFAAQTVLNFSGIIFAEPFILPLFISILGSLFLYLWLKKEQLATVKNIVIYYLSLLIISIVWAIFIESGLTYGKMIAKILIRL